MSHEPTEKELRATARTMSMTHALTAANALRDKRIRNEALEEAARVADELDGHRHRDIAASIRALKDTSDGPDSET